MACLDFAKRIFVICWDGRLLTNIEAKYFEYVQTQFFLLIKYVIFNFDKISIFNNLQLPIATIFKIIHYFIIHMKKL